MKKKLLASTFFLTPIFFVDTVIFVIFALNWRTVTVSSCWQAAEGHHRHCLPCLHVVVLAMVIDVVVIVFVAVVLHLDINHPDILEFVQAERHELPWVKRCVNLTTGLWSDAETGTKEAILRGIARGDIWLNKIKHDRNGKRIRGNVCLEVYLPSRGTCLLQHINLSACRIGDLRPSFREGMQELCSLHGKTGVGSTGEYLKPEVDRQVGLGMLGLANFLANNNISYAEFGKALEATNNAEPYEGYA